MDNLCEIWLQKMFSSSDIVENPVYAGNDCFAKLDARTVVHFSFEYIPGNVQPDYGKTFTGLFIKIINTTKGPVDELMIPFTSAWTYIADPPYIKLEYPNGPGQWVDREPCSSEINLLMGKVKKYIDMFK